MFISSSNLVQLSDLAQAVLLLVLLLPPGCDVLHAVQHDPLRLAQRQHLLTPRPDTRLLQGDLDRGADHHHVVHQYYKTWQYVQRVMWLDKESNQRRLYLSLTLTLAPLLPVLQIHKCDIIP